jgi:hypothetical protein
MNYDPEKHPIEYLRANNIPVGITSTYFRNFIVAAHHSKPHLILDLLKQKQNSIEEIARLLVIDGSLRLLELEQLIRMIDIELAKYNIDEVSKIEEEDTVYWVDKLARQSALEITTYARVRPETMNLLMLLSEDQFVNAMSKAGHLINAIKSLSDIGQNISPIIPDSLPVNK